MDADHDDIQFLIKMAMDIEVSLLMDYCVLINTSLSIGNPVKLHILKYL